MSVPSVKERVMLAIQEQAVRDVSLIPRTQLIDLGFDEIDMVELTISLEEEFGIDIADNEAVWVTVGDCVDYIEHAVRQK